MTPEGHFDRPEEVLDFLYESLNDQKGPLGLKYVARAGEQLLPEYPAAVVAFDDLQKTIRGTRYFQVLFSCMVFVLHADLNKSRKVRYVEDLELATKVVHLLEDNPRCTVDGVDRTSFSFINGESPGRVDFMRRGTDRAQSVVATRLDWACTHRVPFREA